MLQNKSSHTDSDAQFPALDIGKTLNTIMQLIKKNFPVPARFKSALPSDIAELSRLLTNRRGERYLSYLARPNLLCAYIYYFLPWNLYRLCLLLPGLKLRLRADDIITDLGCGPLTFTSALWIAYPQLRETPLEFNCIDRSAQALEAGKNFFSSLCETDEKITKWKINIIKEDIDLRKVNFKSTAARYNKTNREAKASYAAKASCAARAACDVSSSNKNKKSALICAVNLFNELYDNLSHNNTEELGKIAFAAAGYMHNKAEDAASILTVEPGVPQSGRFISLLRGRFMELNRQAASPCTHNKECPLSPARLKRSYDTSGEMIKRKGQKTNKKWCHFAFEANDAPEELRRLSAAAGLPKERLAFSYLLLSRVSEAVCGEVSRADTSNELDKAQPEQRAQLEQHAQLEQRARVISDVFSLPENNFGCYGCSAKGLVLLTGKKNQTDKIKSGNLIVPVFGKIEQRDAKSGALIAGLPKE